MYCGKSDSNKYLKIQRSVKWYFWNGRDDKLGICQYTTKDQSIYLSVSTLKKVIRKSKYIPIYILYSISDIFF